MHLLSSPGHHVESTTPSDRQRHQSHDQQSDELYSADRLDPLALSGHLPRHALHHVGHLSRDVLVSHSIYATR